jgi:hypothetical protein
MGGHKPGFNFLVVKFWFRNKQHDVNIAVSLPKEATYQDPHLVAAERVGLDADPLKDASLADAHHDQHHAEQEDNYSLWGAEVGTG